jgi:hypothetical protein
MCDAMMSPIPPKIVAKLSEFISVFCSFSEIQKKIKSKSLKEIFNTCDYNEEEDDVVVVVVVVVVRLV